MTMNMMCLDVTVSHYCAWWSEGREGGMQKVRKRKASEGGQGWRGRKRSTAPINVFERKTHISVQTAEVIDLDKVINLTSEE